MPNKIYYAVQEVIPLSSSLPGEAFKVIGFMPVFDSAEDADAYAEEESLTLISFVAEILEEEEISS